jgi:hypothetical protein
MALEMNLWRYFHTYFNLARMGLLEPLTCPTDGFTLITKMEPGDDENPRLWCTWCGSVFQPGSDLISKVKEAVDEYLGDT